MLSFRCCQRNLSSKNPFTFNYSLSMALFYPESSIPWNRVLPKPAPLLHEPFNQPLTRPNTSLLQHHITSESSFRGTIDNFLGRRSTILTFPQQQQQQPPPPPSRDLIESTLPSSSSALILAKVQDNDPVTRKRSASLMENSPQSRTTSPSIQKAIEEPTNHFCLCQPDPKIPRPRNAFILYRQHYQAAVVAHHPGLANPEISKIIGKQWRSLPGKLKNEWKELAEKEKARHQQQYPDYRYQPRRCGRNGLQPANSSSSVGGSDNFNASGICLKCGGKIPRAPLTPSSQTSPSFSTMPPQLSNGQQNPTRGYTMSAAQQHARQIGLGINSSPQPGRVRPYTEVFSADPRIRYMHGNVSPMPMTPDPKRRRFDNAGLYLARRGEVVSESPYQFSPRRTSLPRADPIPHQRQQMEPPLKSAYLNRPGAIMSPMPPLRSHDPSLVLPPLKTQSNNQGQKGGVEAMIRSIPVLNKIKILNQIAPHLAEPSPASPPYETRGAIIAIEGLDKTKVANMTEYLRGELERTEKFAVKTFTAPDAATMMGEIETFEAFLAAIGTWHGISKEMCNFITTIPADDKGWKEVIHAAQGTRMTFERKLSSDPKEEMQRRMSSLNGHGEEVEGTSEPDTSDSGCISAVSPRPMVFRETYQRRNESPSDRIDFSTASARPTLMSSVQGSQPRRPSKIPIAIVSRYRLTTVDISAVSVPITDSYSPFDHWKWLATLWRGCVGPDVTIVISGPGLNGEPEEGGNVAGAGPGVDVRLQDLRTVIVRLGAGGGEGGEDNDGRLEEKALRRVGFEVEEFLRK